MLLEADVVEAVCKRLTDSGYHIHQKLTTTQQGYDIIAIKETPNMNRKLFVEAKGATSSRKGSNRFGLLFDRAQVRIHISEALFKTAEALSLQDDHYDIKVAIAVPKNKDHIEHVEKIMPVIEKLGIAIFFVDDLSVVEIHSSWEL